MRPRHALPLLLLLITPAATAEQDVWTFDLDSGALQTPITVYASQNYPTGNVPAGSQFAAMMLLQSSNSDHDVVGDGVQTTGCTLLNESVAPGTDEQPWRVAHLELRMEDTTCSVTRWALIMDEAQLTTIYNHTFTFTVEAFSMTELGQDPDRAGVYPALMGLAWLGVMWFAVWRMGEAGPRYLGVLLFAVLGFIGHMLPDVIPGLVLTGYWGVALGLFVVALLNRFGTENRDPRRPQ